MIENLEASTKRASNVHAAPPENASAAGSSQNGPRSWAMESPIQDVSDAASATTKVSTSERFSVRLGFKDGSDYKREMEKVVRELGAKFAPDVEIDFTYKSFVFIGHTLQIWIDATGPTDQVDRFWTEVRKA